MRSVISFISPLWRREPVLVGFAAVLAATLIPAGLGLALDPRVIEGAPAWLKPAKFALSTTVYALTLAWVFQWLPDWPRVRRAVGWTTGIVFSLEVAIIDLQAWRGTTSHFNASTPLDGLLFFAMGLAIGLQTLASLAVVVALLRERGLEPARAWTLRGAMVLTVLGASTGGLMTRPTPEQLSAAAATHAMPYVGGHTVGGPDGGPGLPGTTWSVAHGDLRVPHFVGLHAMQALPLVGWWLPLGWPVRRRVAGMAVATSSYAALFALLLVQALRGEPLVAPSPGTAAMLGVWAGATILAATAVLWRPATRLSANAAGGRS